LEPYLIGGAAWYHARDFGLTAEGEIHWLASTKEEGSAGLFQTTKKKHGGGARRRSEESKTQKKEREGIKACWGAGERWPEVRGTGSPTKVISSVCTGCVCKRKTRFLVNRLLISKHLSRESERNRKGLGRLGEKKSAEKGKILTRTKTS